MNDSLEGRILGVNLARERALILAHPCAGTRFTCDHLRDILCPDASEGVRNRVVRHESVDLADAVKDTSQTVMLPASEVDGATLRRLFALLYGRKIILRNFLVGHNRLLLGVLTLISDYYGEK